jgi:hypothetical protein
MAMKSESGWDILGHEILAEKAAALGRAGEKVEVALTRLRENASAGAERARLVREAGEAVYAYLIQRELCGMRRHAEIIRELGVPKEVLARLGAK